MSHARGLPVAFLIRMVLEQPSLEKAVKFITSVKHASGQNYIIGGLEKVVCLECSSNVISEYTPYEGARRVYHTNHPLANGDVALSSRSSTGTSLARFSFLEGRLRDPSKKVTVDTIKYILSSHEGPICVHNSYQPVGGVTFASLIYELSRQPVLHITVGPPCSYEWKILRF